MSLPRPSLLDEADPRLFLDQVAWGWRPSERLQRLAYYPEFLARLVSVESHGLRDGLIHSAARIFGTTIRAVRADLRAAEDLAALERMGRLAARPSRSAP